MRSAPSLTIEPRRSRVETALLLAALLLALCAIWLSALPVILQWLSSALVALSGVHRALGRRQEIRRAVLQSDGIWMLAIAGEQLPASLDSSTLLAGLISLTWRVERDGKRLTLLLWPDALQPDTARPLRVWLRSSRAHATLPEPS